MQEKKILVRANEIQKENWSDQALFTHNQATVILKSFKIHKKICVEFFYKLKFNYLRKMHGYT